MTWARAPAGLASGPRMLNAVRTARARRTGMTAFMAGWRLGACRKAKRWRRRDSAPAAGVSEMGMPRASRTSAEPQSEVTARLPCLATVAPAAAATSAAAVEMLKSGCRRLLCRRCRPGARVRRRRGGRGLRQQAWLQRSRPVRARSLRERRWPRAKQRVAGSAGCRADRPRCYLRGPGPAGRAPGCARGPRAARRRASCSHAEP